MSLLEPIWAPLLRINTWPPTGPGSRCTLSWEIRNGFHGGRGMRFGLVWLDGRWKCFLSARPAVNARRRQAPRGRGDSAAARWRVAGISSGLRRWRAWTPPSVQVCRGGWCVNGREGTSRRSNAALNRLVKKKKARVGGGFVWGQAAKIRIKSHNPAATWILWASKICQPLETFAASQAKSRQGHSRIDRISYFWDVLLLTKSSCCKNYYIDDKCLTPFQHPYHAVSILTDDKIRLFFTLLSPTVSWFVHC